MFRLDVEFSREVKKRYKQVVASRRSKSVTQDDEYEVHGGDDYDYSEDLWSKKDYQRLWNPSEKTIRTVIEVCFWASLGKEEERNVDFCVTLSPPPQDRNLFLFKNRVSFASDQLVKLAPAIEPSQSVIGTWYEANGTELRIWGFTSRYRDEWLSLKTCGPGQLILKLPKENLRCARALVTGSKACFLDNPNPFHPARTSQIGPYQLPRLVRFLSFEFRLNSAVEFMWRYGHGGTLLVVPNDDESWEKSFKDSIPYAPESKYERVSKGFEEVRKDPVLSPAHRLINNQFLALIARLTAVDGATVITRDGVVLAFGAKIKPIDSNKGPEKVLVRDPFRSARKAKLSELGGTRHQSAAQFAFDQRNSYAIVVSQDRRVSVAAWDHKKQFVAVNRHAEYFLI